MDLTTTDTIKLDGCGEQCAQVARHLAWIGDRWTLPVMVMLDLRPMRFNELRRAVTGISQQMLTTTLRKLWRDGIVTRTVHGTVPPQVEYALTDLGKSLAGQGKALGNWVQTNLPALAANREAHDAAALSR